MFLDFFSTLNKLLVITKFDLSFEGRQIKVELKNLKLSHGKDRCASNGQKVFLHTNFALHATT